MLINARGIDTSVFTPASAVVDELKASPLPRSGKAAMAAISVETLLPSPHGGLAWPYAWSPFLCLFGFKQWTGSIDAFPAWDGVFITTADGSQSHTSAAGVWQDQKGTYADISTKTGLTSFSPQDQIANNWALAVKDFKTRTGGDLQAVLEAGEIEKVSPALIATWPEGADANFPARYKAALALFPPVAPPSPPAIIVVPLGQRWSAPITSATHEDGTPATDIPADLLKSDDTAVCVSLIAGRMLMIDSVAPGQTTVHGADQTLLVTVPSAPAPITHLVIDFAKAVLSPTLTSVMTRVPVAAAFLATMLAGGGIVEREAPVPVPLALESQTVSVQAAVERPVTLRFEYEPGKRLSVRWEAIP